MTDDMELKRAIDALPREIEPPAEAWSGIRRRIQSSQAPARRVFEWPEHFRPRTIRIAAGIAMIGAGLTYLAMNTRLDARWMVTSSPGQVVGTAAGIRRYALTNGQVVETGIERASIKVGDIGWVDAWPQTKLQLLHAGPTEQRMALESGYIRVNVKAPPRVFVVQTPAGIATDMGCAYTLSVDSARTSVLKVSAGWVEFEEHGLHALVPQGFTIRTPVGRPLGTPVSDRVRDRGDYFRAMIEAFDTFGMGSDTLIARIAAAAEPGDAVTLWHLLGRPKVTETQREILFDRLAWLTPPPAGVTRSGVVHDLNPLMLRLWWEQLPGTLKIDTGFATWLWTVWLKVANWL